jgi:hypothetical protein
VSVQDALGAFDFLDTEETEEGETNPYVDIYSLQPVSSITENSVTFFILNIIGIFLLSDFEML